MNLLYEQMIRAIFANDLKCLSEIIAKIEQNDYHALLNQKTDFGHTPLILSVKLIPSNIQYYDVVKLLLQKDADPRIRDNDGWSCFEEAI